MFTNDTSKRIQIKNLKKLGYCLGFLILGNIPIVITQGVFVGKIIKIRLNSYRYVYTSYFKSSMMKLSKIVHTNKL